MKIAMKRLIKNEKGQALVMVLILLLIGGLIIGPLLSYMGNGLNIGSVYEGRTAELYAADAGVEDAVLQIEQGEVVLCPGNPTYNYNISDVNGKSVDVAITSINGVGNLTLTYRVVSTAAGDGIGTEIEAYIKGVSQYGDYAGLLGQVLTSKGEINIKGEVNPPDGEHGPEEYYDDPWPTAEELAEWYLKDVAGGTHYDGDTEIDLEGNSCPPGPIYINDEENNSWPSGLGPLYVDGELEITNSINNDPPPTLTLTGTVYVTGDTLIKPNKEMTLDLNGQTIFVASDTTGTPALWIGGGKLTILGPGIIMAVGDIYFEPNIPVGMTEPIFIMSVEGETLLQPGGDFYGSIAGSVEVQLQPGSSVSYPEDADWYENLNFLIGFKMLIFHIASWEVTPLSREEV